MSEQTVDVNDVLASLKETIGQLEMDKAFLTAQIRALQAEANNPPERSEATEAEQGEVIMGEPRSIDNGK